MSSCVLLQSPTRDLGRRLEPRKHVHSWNEIFFRSIYHSMAEVLGAGWGGSGGDVISNGSVREDPSLCPERSPLPGAWEGCFQDHQHHRQDAVLTRGTLPCSAARLISLPKASLQPSRIPKAWSRLWEHTAGLPIPCHAPLHLQRLAQSQPGRTSAGRRAHAPHAHRHLILYIHGTFPGRST